MLLLFYEAYIDNFRFVLLHIFLIKVTKLSIIFSNKIDHNLSNFLNVMFHHQTIALVVHFYFKKWSVIGILNNNKNQMPQSRQSIFNESKKFNTKPNQVAYICLLQKITNRYRFL